MLASPGPCPQFSSACGLLSSSFPHHLSFSGTNTGSYSAPLLKPLSSLPACHSSTPRLSYSQLHCRPTPLATMQAKLQTPPCGTVLSVWNVCVHLTNLENSDSPLSEYHSGCFWPQETHPSRIFIFTLQKSGEEGAVYVQGLNKDIRDPIFPILPHGLLRMFTSF